MWVDIENPNDISNRDLFHWLSGRGVSEEYFFAMVSGTGAVNIQIKFRLSSGGYTFTCVRSQRLVATRVFSVRLLHAVISN